MWPIAMSTGGPLAVAVGLNATGLAVVGLGEAHSSDAGGSDPSGDSDPLATSVGGGGKASATARILGSGVSGFAELAVFHPVDTVAKRLMSNKEQWRGRVNEIVFRDAAEASALTKWGSLFPGVGFGAAYKVLQRIYKFGGQPYVYEYINRNHSDAVPSKTLQQAVSGSIMGIGEVVLLPLDVLKIKAQTNPEVLRGRGIVNLVQTEGLRLYAGIGWTMARNAPGSFALFGGNSMAKKAMGLEETMGGEATWWQNGIASASGSIASIAVAQPLDVVKTRIQNRPFDSPESGASIIKNLIKNEGAGAFFKGLTPKLIVVGPKLVFSFTIAQSLISYFQKQGY